MISSVSGSITRPYTSRWDGIRRKSIARLLGRRMNTLPAIDAASPPLMRTTPMPPTPGAVAMAAMVDVSNASG